MNLPDFITDLDYEEFKAKLEELGISVTNSDGTFKTLMEVIEELAGVWNSLENKSKD